MVVNINPYKNISSLKPCPALLERSFAPEKCSPPLGMFSHVTQRALVPSARNPMLLRSNRPKRALYGDSCLKSRMFCVSRSLQKWYLQVLAKRCLLSEYQSRQGRSRPWCPTRVLSCQIFHADKNLVEEQNRGNDPHFAAVLPKQVPKPRPWPNTLNWVWEARSRSKNWRTVGWVLRWRKVEVDVPSRSRLH